jgi:hypothetical protein
LQNVHEYGTLRHHVTAKTDSQHHNADSIRTVIHPDSSPQRQPHPRTTL